MHRNFLILLASTLLCSSFSMPTWADKGDLLSKERFRVRVRAIDVVPDEKSSANIGGHVDVTDKVTPELDLSYFLTDHIAAEIIAATSKHNIKHSSGASLGSAWILPPTVTLQYHFTPDKSLSPYMGAGLNYSIFYNEKEDTGFTDLKVHNGIGYALQLGTDYWIDRNWGLNLDIKKIFLNVDATLNQGAVRADVDLDPWVIGAGVSYRF